MQTRINADFTKRVVIRPEDYQWVDSPMPGVQRMMLDRIGDEVARATILVKLHQFYEADTVQKAIDTHNSPWYQGMVDGLTVMPLHNFEGEHAALVRWQPNTQFNSHKHWGGEEIFVIEGTFYDEHGCYPQGSWIRSPHLSQHTPYTKDDGALIFVKTGHLSG